LLVVFHCRYFRNFLDKDSLTFKRKHSLSFHISVRCPICRCRESTSTCYSSNYLIFLYDKIKYRICQKANKLLHYRTQYCSFMNPCRLIYYKMLHSHQKQLGRFLTKLY
jgi:hypothetical protein